MNAQQKTQPILYLGNKVKIVNDGITSPFMDLNGVDLYLNKSTNSTPLTIDAIKAIVATQIQNTTPVATSQAAAAAPDPAIGIALNNLLKFFFGSSMNYQTFSTMKVTFDASGNGSPSLVSS